MINNALFGSGYAGLGVAAKIHEQVIVAGF
jgi:hypothetical protein